MTFRERLIAGLLANGWKEDKADKSRYPAFHNPEHVKKLFVGKNGALRSGRCASKSQSVGLPVHQTELYKRILADGDKVLELARLAPKTPVPMNTVAECFATCTPEIAQHFGLDQLPPHLVRITEAA